IIIEFLDMADLHSQELLTRVRGGDDAAAEELFHRFADRLIALAAIRMSEKLARRVGPEDVVQSAYRIFFVGARDGRYALEQSRNGTTPQSRFLYIGIRPARTLAPGPK